MSSVVLLTCRLPPELVDELQRHAAVVSGAADVGNMPRAHVISQLADVVAIINQNELRIDAELLSLAPKLRIVANCTAGFDNMDLTAMRSRGVWGTNAPDSYAADTANHAIGLLLAVTRRIVEADRYVRSGHWARDGWMPGGRWDGLSLDGKHLGIVGYGSIGQQVERRAAAFGMVVHHYSPSGSGRPGYLPFGELLCRSDVISLHCPLTDATRHLFDASVLREMQPGAVLINTARGQIVKNVDLIAALRAGWLGGAGLDVFETEPEIPVDLIDMPNVVLTPHLGGCTQVARLSAQRVCVDNVLHVLAGRAPRTSVTGLPATSPVGG